MLMVSSASVVRSLRSSFFVSALLTEVLVSSLTEPHAFAEHSPQRADATEQS
jgi:hypothetical protein